MKKIINSILFLLAVTVNAQNIEKFSIDSGGATSISGGIEIVFTIGEVNVEELAVSNIQLSEGFINSSSSGALSVNSLIKNQIIIYPNPTSKYINISSKNNIDNIEIFNLQGKKVLTATNKNKIVIDKLQTGFYLVKFYTEIGSITKKIIIK